MLRLFPAIAVLIFAPTLAPEQNDGVERLRDVGSVYVAELGRTEKAKALKQELINELGKSKRIRVVDAPDEADAVLSASVRHGSKNVDRAFEVFGEPGMKTGSEVVPTQEVVFRLDTRQNQTLWVAKFDFGESPGRDERQAVRALANKVSSKLQKAVEKDSKRRR